MSAATWDVRRDSIWILFKLFTALVLISAKLAVVKASSCVALSPGVCVVVILDGPTVFKAYMFADDKLEICAEVSAVNWLELSMFKELDAIPAI